MKTIFRYTTFTVLLAAILAVGALAALAQNPCDETDAIAGLDAKFRENYGKKDVPSRMIAVESGKQFIEKYGACETQKDFVAYLKSYLPGMEKKIKDDKEKDKMGALYERFNASVKSSNFDETYASGKEILSNIPDQLDVMIALGSIGYDESYKKNYKYNVETLKYARQSIDALQSGKTSKNFGIFQWTYKSKDNALGWLNYTIGYIYQYAQKDKKAALPFLYKASQLASETKTNPLVYESIGLYYIDELNKQIQELQDLVKIQNDADTTEVKQQKVDAIKAKVGLVNGTAERALDAYSRAHSLSSPDPKNATYRNGLYKSLQDVYKIRFEKGVSLDAWMKTAVTKAFVDPSTSIAPVMDPEPAASPTTPATTVKPGTPVLPVKPTTAPATKPVTPAAKPATVAKPGATATKKVVVPKKGTK